MFKKKRCVGVILLPSKPVFKAHWLGSKLRSVPSGRLVNLVSHHFFVTSPCVKELKCQSCILSNPEQAGGNAF